MERQARAACCRRREDALRCVAAEALLRYALGTDIGRVEMGPCGKPFLPDRPDFFFNLSHSGNWVVLACGDSEVGVDVQSLRSNTNPEAMARRFFSPEEQRYVFEKESCRDQRFFEIWTGKESYLKYLGTGLGRTLPSFSVLSPEPGIRFHRRKLPDGSLLCLCTTEDEYIWKMVDVNRL